MVRIIILIAAILAALLVFSLLHGPGPRMGGLSPNASIFATGLDNPRGLKFGPDGFLYVAEAGSGGSTSTEGKCPQVVPPVGPYLGGNTSRISKISSSGQRTTVVDKLPSDQTSEAIGSEVSGASSVDFVGDTLYAIVVAGCSHGNLDMPSALMRVNPDGTTTQIVDLSAFWQANPVANPQLADFEPDGTAYSLVDIGNDLLVVEPNHGELDKITGSGVSRVIDISATQGHVVPTTVIVGPDGNFYVGNLSVAPYADGSANIYKITPGGQISIFAHGLTAVLGLAFDSRGRLYALEASTGNTSEPPFMVPGSGKVLRLTDKGTFETIASGLTFPTAMTFGPDGNLYISNVGFGQGPAAGKGQIVKIRVK